MPLPFRQLCRFIQIARHTNYHINSVRQVHTTGVRCLFSADTLGLEHFKRHQAVTKDKIGDLHETFRLRMDTYMEAKTNTIFTGDLKNMIYIASSNEDLNTVNVMIDRFRDQRGELRFSTFVFGPIVMRMYSLLKQPTTALAVFEDHRHNDGFFDQLSSISVLQDMLFESGRYDDVLKVTDMVKERRVGGYKYPADCILLTFASCCKLNTPDAYKYLLDMIEGIQEIGTKISLRSLVFAAHLALQQGDSKTALELIENKSDYKGPVPPSYTNIKVLALTGIGRVQDAIMELRCLLNADGPDSHIHDVFPDVLNALTKAVEATGDLVVLQRMKELRMGLEDNSHVHTIKFEEYIYNTVERKRQLQDSFKSRQRSGTSGYGGNEHKARGRPGLRRWEDQVIQ